AFSDFSAVRTTTKPFSALITDRTTGRATSNWDLETSYWTHAYDSSKKIYIYVPKGTYANLTEAQTGLAGTTVIYQLAEPVEIPIEVSGNIVSYPSGTI